MRAQPSQEARKLAEEIRRLPSQPLSAANILFIESIQCKVTAFAATSLSEALAAANPRYRHDDSREELPILVDIQPPLI